MFCVVIVVVVVFMSCFRFSCYLLSSLLFFLFCNCSSFGCLDIVYLYSSFEVLLGYPFVTQYRLEEIRM